MSYDPIPTWVLTDSSTRLLRVIGAHVQPRHVRWLPLLSRSIRLLATNDWSRCLSKESKLTHLSKTYCSLKTAHCALNVKVKRWYFLFVIFLTNHEMLCLSCLNYFCEIEVFSAILCVHLSSKGYTSLGKKPSSTYLNKLGSSNIIGPSTVQTYNY